MHPRSTPRSWSVTKAAAGSRRTGGKDAWSTTGAGRPRIAATTASRARRRSVAAASVSSSGAAGAMTTSDATVPPSFRPARDKTWFGREGGDAHREPPSPSGRGDR